MTPRAVTTTIIRSVNNYPTSTYKSTTGLVGIEVDFDARNTLLDLTAQCLQSVQVCVIPFIICVNLIFLASSVASST
jgi:hypothetical protein